MATDPLIQVAVDLKKEIADVDSPELDGIMDEIMKLILGAANPPDDRVAPTTTERSTS